MPALTENKKIVHVWVDPEVHYKIKLRTVTDSTTMAGVVERGIAALEELEEQKLKKTQQKQGKLFKK